jgi:hypothetical protein
MTVSFGAFLGQNGDQFHETTLWIRSITLTEVGCTELVPGPGDPGDPGPQNPPPPINPGDLPPVIPVAGDWPFGVSDESPMENGTPTGSFNSLIYKCNKIADTHTFLATALANNWKVILMLQGPQGLWMSGGVFDKRAWIAAVRRFAGDSIIAARILDGTIYGFYVIDEPQKIDRYGRFISGQELIELVAVVLELFPNSRTFIRIRPSVYNIRIPGLTGWWLNYHTRLGDASSAIAKDVSDCIRLGVPEMARGLNISNINGVGSPGATPSQVLAYGTPLARHPYPGPYLSWKYDANTPSLLTALAEVDTIYQASRV